MDEDNIFNVADINCFADWARFLTECDTVKFVDRNYTLCFFGEKEKAYLVIEIKSDPNINSVEEFVFHPMGEKDKLLTLFAMLSTLDYSVEKLIELINSSDYQEDGMTEILLYENVEISRHGFTEVKKRGK